MSDTATSTEHLKLVTVGGPDERSLVLEPPGPLTIGRRTEHDLALTDPASRDHAILIYEDRSGRGLWYIIDTESKHGTRLNGVALLSGRRYPVEAGDLIEIKPWTFQIVDPLASQSDKSVVQTIDDAAADQSNINIIDTTAYHEPTKRRLALLLRCAEAMHRADDEQSLAEVVLDAAVSGTGFANAAFLKPMTADGSIRVLSQRGKAVGDASNPKLSRSLIHKASSGTPVRLTHEESQLVPGVSIVELGIHEAMCVPIMLGETVAGFLYLDNRRNDSDTGPVATDAADFAIGIAQLAAMSLANLMRLDLQRRSIELEADLRATGEAQQMLLPRRKQQFGRWLYTGENRAGRLVSGDFFDVIELADDRIAVTLGDVVGKGIRASVLMTTAHGFLHAALSEHGDPARAVRELNRFIQPRCSSGVFITLWLGVFDANAHTLHYADFGHGHAVLLPADGDPTRLTEAGGMPIGINAEIECDATEIPFRSGDRAVIVSDGLVEQTSRKVGSERPKQFGLDAIIEVLRNASADDDQVAMLFDAVVAHAGTEHLADDATALLVRWA